VIHQIDVDHRGWNGSWASDYDNRPELGSAPGGSPAAVSWTPGRLDASVIDRAGNLLHTWFGLAILYCEAFCL